MGGRHELGYDPAEEFTRKAPGGLLTLEDLSPLERDMLSGDELVDHDPAFVYADDPDVHGSGISIPRRIMPMTVDASLVQRVAALGDRNAAMCIDRAAAAGLEVACAVVLRAKESGGGQNIYGHDGVDTGGCYVKGGPVTQQNYGCYIGKASSGKIGRQGVGDVQLTWGGYQRAADSRGGCWRSDISTAVGFETLAAGIRANGVRTAFRAYNGSGAAAERYADDALARLAKVRAALAGAPAPTPAPAPSPGPRPDASTFPTLREGDTNELVWRLQVFMNKNYGLYSNIDAGTRPPSRLGPQTVAVMEQFQARQKPPISTAKPFGIGRRTWQALIDAGFR